MKMIGSSFCVLMFKGSLAYTAFRRICAPQYNREKWFKDSVLIVSPNYELLTFWCFFSALSLGVSSSFSELSELTE